MERCRFMRSISPAICAGLGIVASPVCAPKAHADAEWQFAGAYTEDGYTSEYVIGGNGSATASLVTGYAATSASAGYSDTTYARYRYYPSFAWTGPTAGNPNAPMTYAAVYATGTGSGVQYVYNDGSHGYDSGGGSAGYDFSLTTPYTTWRDGGPPASTTGNSSSPNMSLGITPVSANLSFSTDWIEHITSAAATAFFGPRGGGSNIYSSTSAITVGYITAY